MNSWNQPTVAQLYQTDLERHLFAPAANRTGRRRGWLAVDRIARWLRDWFEGGRSRRRALAEA